jgi:Ca2+-binding EF-hand superfamily protein
MADKIKAKLLEKLAGLQKKEEDLQALLESVDVSLYDMGYHIEKETNSKSGKVMPQTGIRIGGKLSFRGKEKSAEYFKLIDTDNDGYVNFEDLRGSPVIYKCRSY